MFSAAILDAFPEFWSDLRAFLVKLNINCDPEIKLSEFTDGVLCGNQFSVTITNADDHGHHHAHWSHIRKWILELNIDDDVKHHAIGIFNVLAQAEAKIHGKDIENVCFHEVGAWDSITDIMSASWLIAKLDNCTWSVSKLPWGGGKAKTDHGLIPVPAPATVELLKGYEFFDDGVTGERITPTGAAILAWLSPSGRQSHGMLSGFGHGFGTKKLAGMSNVLRACVMKKDDEFIQGSVVIMECDIDDQSPESLACGIDILQKLDDVIDITQNSSIGKKGRLSIQLRLLVKVGCERSVAKQIFAQTTTIGIRYYMAHRFELYRGHSKSAEIRTKWVDRPTGTTAKAEMDDLARITHSHSARESARNDAEADTIKAIENDNK